MPNPRLLVGTAGWSIPRDAAERFSPEGTHLQRYGTRLPAAEINSSFSRPHRASTYERWAASVPDGFRFSVKLPKEITHTSRLKNAERLTGEFLASATALGEKLGCLLVQLPPSLAFHAAVAESFFSELRERYDGPIVCEPRHASWFDTESNAVMMHNCIARVAADPDRPPGAGEPGGWTGLQYYRLHGSPQMYYSNYSVEHLLRIAELLRRALAEGTTAWCIFDNTAAGAATANALDLLKLVPAAPEAL